MTVLRVRSSWAVGIGVASRSKEVDSPIPVPLLNLRPWRADLALRRGFEVIVVTIVCALVGFVVPLSLAEFFLPQSAATSPAQVTPAPVDTALRNELEVKRALIETITQRDAQARVAIETVRRVAKALPRGVTLERLDVDHDMRVDGRAVEPQSLDAYVAALREGGAEVTFHGRERSVESDVFSLVIGL